MSLSDYYRCEADDEVDANGNREVNSEVNSMVDSKINNKVQRSTIVNCGDGFKISEIRNELYERKI